jgi:hypothetical protein
MRHIVLALCLCFVSGSLLTPLHAAVRTSNHATTLVKAKKSKVKVRGHKAPKIKNHSRTRAN